MKALSIKNPWAWLIANGHKDVENRTWRTKYRGKVLIHVSAKWDDGRRDMSNMFTFEQWNTLPSNVQTKLITQINIPTSAIIGQVEIVDVVENHPSVWSVQGHYQWVLENPILFNNHIPEVKGRLSIWNFETDEQTTVIIQRQTN